MSGIDDRVKEFIGTWQKRKTGEIPATEEATCSSCGIILDDGNFILIDGDLLCLKCRKEKGGYVKHDLVE
jgi:hypothetical protein